jgi:triacylglycerol lipase
VWDSSLLPCLTRLKDEQPARTFWFTGHSLGAALATLAADRYRDVQGLYTFGSPLVGDRAFAHDFFVNAFRIVNNNDFVAHVPPFGPCVRPPHVRPYEHVGQLKYISSEGVLQDNPSRWARLTDGFKGRYGHLVNLAGQLRSGWIGELPDDGFNDHAPLFYALRVWNAYASALSTARGESR